MLSIMSLRLLNLYKKEHLIPVLKSDEEVRELIESIIEARHKEIVKKHLKILQS